MDTTRSRAGRWRGIVVPLLCLALVPLAGESQSPRVTGTTEGSRLTLAALLDSVSRRHPLSLAADARLRVARGSERTARLPGNPLLSFDIEHAGSAAPTHGSQGMVRESMATAMLPLESVYGRAPRVRGAAALTRAAFSDAVAERRSLALDAARAFYRAALAQVSVATARDLTAWLDSLVEYNEHRVAEGAAAEVELLRSELERDRAVATLAISEADLARAMAALAAWVGNSTSTMEIGADEGALALPSELRVAGSEHSPAAGSGAAGVMDRPETRAARERVTAADAALSAERVLVVRQLGVTVGAKRMGGVSSLVTGLSLPFPLFDQNRGEVARAAAERDAATHELAAVDRSVRAELVGAQAAAAALSTRLASLGGGRGASLLARADEARRITLASYREGASSLLEVLDAARTWGEARVTWYQALYAQHESVLELLVALGEDPVRVAPRLRTLPAPAEVAKP